MRKLACLVTLTAFQYALSLAHAEPDDAPVIPPPDDMEIVPIRAEDARKYRSIGAEKAKQGLLLKVVAAARSSSIRSTGQYIGIVKIQPLFLARPVETDFDPGQPTITSGLPSTLARLDLELEGKTYRLYFADEVVETRTGLRHVTMSVLNDEQSYARFSVDGRTGDIYGTLRIPTETYVFEPGEDQGEQAVYRYASPPKVDAWDDRRRALVGSSLLARRHHQIEALALIQPDTVYSSLLSTYIRGGKLGSVKVVSPESFRELATKMSVLTQATGKESFELIKVIELNGGGKQGFFHELIGGVPIDSVNELTVSKSGSVLSMQVSIAPAHLEPVKALVTEQDAVTRALVEWEACFMRRASKVELSTPVKSEHDHLF